jgi:acyl phosphate:glycerol-3-phosphate acyltransferase
MTVSPLIAAILTMLLSYLVGAIPFGWIIVKISTGRDIRSIESGRTGGTNAMRAAGFFAGAFTAIGDVLKGLSTMWLVAWLIPADAPGRVWFQVIAPLLAIMGHNYSIFMIETRSDGRLHLRGGAGGAPCFGGAMSLWPWCGAIILPVAALVFVLVGYASITTLSIAVTAMVIFAYLAIVYHTPWQFILYGVVSLIILLWALRPNLVRLAQGNERVVGLRAYLQKRKSS